MWTNIPNVLQPNDRPGFDPADWQKSRSGLWLPATVKKKDRYRGQPIAMDLFCGAGGFSLGFMQAGLRVVAGLDNEAFAAITYCYNLGAYPMTFHFDSPESAKRLEKALLTERGRWKKWVDDAMPEIEKSDDVTFKLAVQDFVDNRLPGQGEIGTMPRTGGGWIYHNKEIAGVEHFFFGDVRNFTGEHILECLDLERGDLDCIMGGPPCQGFSRAGKRNVMDPRNSFIRDFGRLVIELLPVSLVMENVPDILTMITPEGIGVVDELCMILEEGGFSTADALKKMLTQDPRARVGMRSSQRTKVKKEKEEKRQIAIAQRDEGTGEEQLKLF